MVRTRLAKTACGRPDPPYRRSMARTSSAPDRIARVDGCVLLPGHYAALARFAAKRRSVRSGEAWLPLPEGGLAGLQVGEGDRPDAILDRRRRAASLAA